MNASDPKQAAIEKTMASLPECIRERIDSLDIIGVRLVVTWRGGFMQSEGEEVAKIWASLCSPVIEHRIVSGTPGKARIEQTALGLTGGKGA